MGTDPEELLRSIERTREELALTVDTIAGRLDPKFVAKRGVGKLRDGVVGVVDGVKARFEHHDHNGHLPQLVESADSPDAAVSAPVADVVEQVEGVEGVEGADGAAEEQPGYRADKALASASSALKNASSAVKNAPKPVIGGGLAALVALAAILYAANRRQRH